MSFVIGDRVLETTTTTGTGNLTLAGAVSGYRAFSAIATVNGDTFYYQISGGTEWEVGLGTRVDSTHFSRTTVYASSNGGALTNFSAGTKEVWMDASAEQLRTTINLNANAGLFNASISCAVAANAATFSLKTAAGNNPSNTDPVFLVFHNASGGQNVIRVSSLLSITIANGATMGFSNGIPGRIWLAVLLSGSTPELVVRNCKATFGLGSGNAVVGFPSNGLITTTAQAGAADDAFLTSYSVTARTNVPFLILGFFDWDDTVLATAGAWATNPNKTVMMTPTTPIPGSVVQTRVNGTFTQANANSAVFVTVIGQTITRSSKCNLVEITCGAGSVLTVNSGQQARVQIANTTQAYANSYSDVAQNSGTNWNFLIPIFIHYMDDPGTTLANNYASQIALVGGAGTVSYPASGTPAWIRLAEFMS